MDKCRAEASFGDDFGDNSCTFHCELEEGHPGKHLESGKLYDDIVYRLEWEGDHRPGREADEKLMRDMDKEEFGIEAPNG